MYFEIVASRGKQMVSKEGLKNWHQFWVSICVFGGPNFLAPQFHWTLFRNGHRAPFLEPMGAISVAVPKQGSMELGGQKIGSPKNTNWDPKLVPIFESLFWHHLLTAWCYDFKIHPACNTCVFFGSARKILCTGMSTQTAKSKILGRTSAKNCGTAPTPFTGHPKALRP